MVKFVAEFTTNHLGNLNLALKMIEEAKQVGCDYIKLQKKDVNTFYSQEKLDKLYHSPYGKTWGDYRRMFEFNSEDFNRIDKKCKELNIKWFSTVQDTYSLDFLLKYDLPIYKVASINARNVNFLKEIEEKIPKDKTIVLSVGGSSLKEIEQALTIINKHQIYLLHCVAEYPCKIENLRLGNIPILKKEFENNRIKIGYSGHGKGITDACVAIMLGAEMVEKHFCLSRHSFTHHIDCALDTEEYQELISFKVALDSSFGMSQLEESFLIKYMYGKEYIQEKSSFGET